VETVVGETAGLWQVKPENVENCAGRSTSA
jgi:hypothetical protein